MTDSLSMLGDEAGMDFPRSDRSLILLSLSDLVLIRFGAGRVAN